MALASAVLGLRRDPRILKLPPYLSLFCIIIGVAWLCLLPLNEYSRHTYISENALLPGQVHTYFGGSEHTIFRAYRQEVAALANEPSNAVAEKLAEIFKDQRLKVGRQKYEYTSAGNTISGENVYGIIQGPRADATEAVVLVAAWRNMDGMLNTSGVALVLTLARYFKRWSLWSKDIIIVITHDSIAGPQAWVEAYHDTHDPLTIQDLPIKSGALQGAIAIDYPAGTGGHRFDELLIHYDGVNGQLPNLDLFNTVVHIASQQLNIKCAIQRMFKHTDSYKDRFETMLRGMLTQGLGHATGPHSSFIPFHIDALLLQTVGDGWHDEMSLGMVIESSIRSLNNLLEHLHQSFFLYLLFQAERFVSIGTYLPSAMLIAVNFSITSIALWVQSGRPSKSRKSAKGAIADEKQQMQVIKEGNRVALVPKKLLKIEERHLFFPMIFVLCSFFLGTIPLFILNNASETNLSTSFHIFAFLSTVLPYITAFTFRARSARSLTLSSCFSLLFLGIALSTLSTLNFSLGLIVGLLASPMSFIRPLTLASADVNPAIDRSQTTKPAKLLITSLALQLVSPTTVLYGSAFLWKGELGNGLHDLLLHAAQAWTIGGTWTAVVVWLVWWPAWFVSAVVCAWGLFASTEAGAEG